MDLEFSDFLLLSILKKREVLFPEIHDRPSVGPEDADRHELDDRRRFMTEGAFLLRAPAHRARRAQGRGRRQPQDEERHEEVLHFFHSQPKALPQNFTSVSTVKNLY